MEFAATLGTELALSALHRIIHKLASYFGGDVTAAEIQHLNDFVRFEITALTREAKSNDLVQSMPLLEKLQAAALELEDLLDLYEYNQIKKQVCPSSSNPIKKFIPKTMLPKSSLRKKFENLLMFVEQVEKIHPFIKSRSGTTQPHVNTVTPTTSTLLSPYFGRENQCESIIDFLLDESHANSTRTNKVPVIAIIGMGGSGKSHTAQHIFNDDRIRDHFDSNMWVHVTRDFDVDKLTRKILESATSDACPLITNLDVLQRKLIESLSNRKRFLLVLDDVWCEDKMIWDLLLSPLNEAPGDGSMIIVTTRTENIADNLNATKFFLEDLTTEECWSILKHYAFSNYEETIDDQELINVGNQIICKAKRSPLALRVVGSSLSNKRRVNEWEKNLKQDVLKDTMELLLFSFQCLPSYLQRCFAYCSLFPKGYHFTFKVNPFTPQLISLWIAQGFIESTSELTLEEAGKNYVEELQSYSFFEKYDKYSFAIHDLLHDLAEKVSKKQCHRIEHHKSLHIPTTCIHLSLYISEMTNVAMSNIVEIFKLGNLRSLIIFEDDGAINIFKNIRDIFQNITKLRALYVPSVRQTEVLGDPHIDKLKHLRYLVAYYSRKLPGSLTKLYHLQFLILYTDLVECGTGCLQANTLPQGFSSLINLRTLRFYHEYSELDYLYYNSEMIKIEKLTSLQNLKTFHPDGFGGMISLRNLSLCGSLEILGLENVKYKEEAEEAMLNQKKEINELTFEWSSTIDVNSNTYEEVLEGLVPHWNLETLNIRGYQGVRFPNWMVKENLLPHLQTLLLWSCRSLKIVPFLPPRLGSLSIRNCHELMQLPPLSHTLHSLKLADCPKLMQLPSLSDNLQELIIFGCNEFSKSPNFSDLSFLTNLHKLELTNFPCLHTLTNLSPTVVKLSIEDCPKLTSLGNLQRCTSLQYITIFRCPMLRRKEPSLVEGVVQGDITNHFPQLTYIRTDEALLVLELFPQQAFSSVEALELRGLQLQRPNLHMSDDYFHHFSSLNHLILENYAALPNLEKLSSLKRLNIDNCPDVESLPNLPVSTLQIIAISGCPKLKEKYEEGGPLRNTISHIPIIVIE